MGERSWLEAPSKAKGEVDGADQLGGLFTLGVVALYLGDRSTDPTESYFSSREAGFFCRKGRIDPNLGRPE
jgi:hypothetical protein